MSAAVTRWIPVLAVVWITGCRDSAPGPAALSGSQSFLTGTWQGTVRTHINPGIPNALPPTSGSTTWTFEVVPRTNVQTFRTMLTDQRHDFVGNCRQTRSSASDSRSC
jgi:hypothetical protein